MTRSGYYFLLALLLIVAVGGAVAAAPSKLELGLVETVSCEEWWYRPVSSDPVRIEGCTLEIEQADLDFFRDGRVKSASVPVRPPGWEPSAEGPDDPQVLWRTTDPEILALVHRLHVARAQEEYEGSTHRNRAYQRALERYAGDLSAPRGIVRIDEVDVDYEWGGRPVRIVDGTANTGLRAMGIVLLMLAVLGIAVLVLLQRRWERRRAQLTGNAQPLRF